MVHASSHTSLLFCFPGIVWALWKVKEVDFNPQLSVWLGKIKPGYSAGTKQGKERPQQRRGGHGFFMV